MDAPTWFIPDRDLPGFYPLQSYLIRPSESVVAEYIDALSTPGDLIIDPHACTPVVAHIAQRMGRRVIAVENNPLWIWLARAMATLPAPSEINGALARLGDTLKDGVPLRTHIQNLYATNCAGCHELTPADYFVWARGAGPIRRHYVCVHCGEEKVGPATEDDLKRAAEYDAHGFHYHFAFERVAPPEGLHTDRIRKILQVYTPRNLYALVTLTVKIDSLFHGTREQDVLLLLLLHLLDRGTSFYVEPSAAATGRLSLHKQFVEFNLWTEVERAARELGQVAPRYRAELTPTLLDVLEGNSPAAFMGRGSARGLTRAPTEHRAALSISSPPQRRLEIWALSYFWGAWILGRAAVESLIASLDSHKSDPGWDRRWYLELLSGSIGALAKLLRSDGHSTWIFRESRHDVVEALFLASSGVRMELETWLFQPGLGDFPRHEFDAISGDYQITFRQGSAEPLKIISEAELASKIRTVALAAGREILRRRGQALAFSWLHHAAYAAAAREGLLAQAMSTNTKIGQALFVSNVIREGLTEGYAHDLDHLVSPEQFVWLRRPPPQDSSPTHAPLFDCIDNAVYDLLKPEESRTRRSLEDEIYRRYPGDLTPEAGLIELCARAYADEKLTNESAGLDSTVDTSRDHPPSADWVIWQGRRQELEADKDYAMRLLARLGERLGYQVARSALFDLTWEMNGEIAHGFVWRARALFEDLARVQVAPAHGYLVIPESQVALGQARVRQLPLLAEAFNEAGWDFMRVPCAEKLEQQETIEQHDIVLIAGLVPPVAGERTQLELF